MNREPDPDLRERFEALRREEEAQAPAFAVPGARSRRPPPLPAWAAAAALVIVAGAALWWLLPRADENAAPLLVDWSATVWRAPTDFLLETPGRDLLRTVPTLGAGELRPEARNEKRSTDSTLHGRRRT